MIVCSFHFVLLCDILAFFFFIWYAYHRDLLSFPTRRSSDLKAHSGQGLVVLGIDANDVSGDARHFAGDRSEEHTSELQSPDQLVCRLLLEKKNRNTTIPNTCSQNVTTIEAIRPLRQSEL